MVGAVGGPQPGGGCGAGIGELGQSGAQETIVEPGQEHRLGEPGAGDLVAVGVRDALDEAVHAQPPQVIAHLPAGDGLGGLAGELRDEGAQVAVSETTGQELEGAQGGEQGVRAQVTEPEPGNAGAGCGDDRAGDGGEGTGPVDRVVAESLGVQETPADLEADLCQGGQIMQPLADAEVNGGR